MRSILGLTVAATIAGCSAAPSGKSEMQTEAPKRVTAVFSCTVNGTPIGVSACLMKLSSDSVGGSLKVASGNRVKQYTDYDLAGENGPTLELPLTAPFHVTAQANSESGYVLHMTVTDGSKSVFQDEATEFGVIDLDDSSLK